MTTDVATRRCEACLSDSLRRHKASQKTGNVIIECRSCGLHALADRPAMDTLTTMLDMDRDRYATWVGTTRTHTIEASHREVLARLSELIGPVENRSLFDVGAGDGGFLALARDSGFQPTGNDLAQGAIDLARESHGIDLMLGDLAVLDDPGLHDVVTMWCVLAHVPDGETLLRDALRVLRPGGILYLQTPRWSAMDRMGMAAHDATRGNATKITDRRLALHHMCLHSAKSMRQLLERLGYEVVSIEPRARYSLTTPKYLDSLGVPPKMRDRMSGIIDGFVDRDWFFRNILDVYARKPS